MALAMAMESGELTHFRCDGLGGAGEEFQRRIALVLLQRATLRNRPFKLAFEMTAAGKFDDVGLFLEPSTEWWLIQAKHSEAGGCLTGDMLLPGDEVARKKGNFSLFKYLESFCEPNVDKLLEEINGDWRLWMRSWIRPDDLGRFSSSQLEQPFNSFKKSFQEWEKSTTATKERSFLELEDGQRFLKNVDRDLGDFVRNCSKRSCTSFVDVERFFIHRQIEVVKEQMGTGIDEYALFYNNIKDADFVDQLYTTFEHQRRFVLVAEPGMGKSILWQYLAFYAQQIYPESAVFLLYMNNFNHQLPPAETLEDVLNVRRLQEMLEKTLDIKAMKLERFDERNQLDFLHKFWHVADSDRAKFEQFAGNLLDKFHRDIQRRKYDFTGLPLMIKMLAEIYSQSYETIAQSDGERVESLEPITVVDLYEKFTKKCIHLTISKKLNIDTERFVPYFEEITQICGRDYQLAAIYKVLPANLLSKVVDKTFSSRLKMFIHKIVDDETLLIELVAGTPQFIHLSYAEYFCATYLYNFLNSSPNLPCVETFTTFLDNHDVIRNFFLAMINEKPTDNHLNFLRKIGDRAAFWSCQGDFITLVNFLKQFYNYRKIRQTIPDWYDNEADELIRQCCQLGGDILGPSLLHLAVEYNALDTLDVLFASRIDVNIRDHKKATPLHYACSSGNIRIVEQLLDRGAKVGAVDGNGYTGLHIAAYEGHLGIVRCLVDHGGEGRGAAVTSSHFINLFRAKKNKAAKL
ncbi:ion channel nompc [Culex quinquefasciatus]|uniref:Ion channel nompc n=1 Tax=Culex quinquefasciatus TaxID=7176 RepID=B0W268_CULQU|nr:ion channel nompc [Culex quinquefasciatus]|eukprot:XP_001842767.1 ion channel nompc [Culex quinquefasciatus]